jgi:RecJ-like exonuclease
MCSCVPCDFCDGGGEIATGTCGRCDGDGKLTLCDECIDRTVRLTPAEVAILREPAHGQLQVPWQPDSGMTEAEFDEYRRAAMLRREEGKA